MAEMAAAEKAAEESAERDRAKHKTDLARPGGEGADFDGITGGGRRRSSVAESRLSSTAVGNAYKANYPTGGLVVERM